MEQPIQPSQSKNSDLLKTVDKSPKMDLFWVVVIAVVATALIVGGLVFWWQRSSNGAGKVKDLQAKITQLESDLSKKEGDVQDKAEAELRKPVISSPESGIKLDSLKKQLVIEGKGEPSTHVWLFRAAEDSEACLSAGNVLSESALVDSTGDFAIPYTPSSSMKESSGGAAFVVVAEPDPESKYKIDWYGAKMNMCVPSELVSDEFLLLAPDVAPISK